MSVPAFAWAIERGRVLGLTTNERCLLMVLADMANGERVCWPLMATLTALTGIKQRALIRAVQRLEACGLIRTEAYGRSQKYHILRGANGAHAAPVKGARDAPFKTPKRAHAAPVQPRMVHEMARMVSNPTTNGAPESPRTLSITKKEPKTREEAQPQDSGGKAASEPSKPAANDDGPPNPPPSAPPAYDPTFTTDGKPRATAEGVHRAAMAAIRALSHREYAPGRSPALTRNEQIDIATKPMAPLDAPLPPIHPAVLPAVLAARRELAERAALRQAAYA